MHFSNDFFVVLGRGYLVVIAPSVRLNGPRLDARHHKDPPRVRRVRAAKLLRGSESLVFGCSSYHGY